MGKLSGIIIIAVESFTFTILVFGCRFRKEENNSFSTLRKIRKATDN